MHLKVANGKGEVAKGEGKEAAEQQNNGETGDESFEETGDESFEEDEEGVRHQIDVQFKLMVCSRAFI